MKNNAKEGKAESKKRLGPQQKLLSGKSHFAEAITNWKIERRGNRLFEVREIALLTTGDMAEMLHCSTQWVIELGKNGLLHKAIDENRRELHGLWDFSGSFHSYGAFLRGQASKANGKFSETDL